MAASDRGGLKKGFLGAKPTATASSSTPQHQPTADPRSQLFQQAEKAKRVLQAGRLAEAEAEFKRLVPLQGRILGPSHQDTMESMHLLATALADQDRREEAEQLFRDLLQMKQETLEIDHPSTLHTASCLAQTLVSQGKHADAEPMLRWVHRINVRVLGANHAATVLGQVGLATSLAHLNRHAEAVELLLDAQPRIHGNPMLLGLAGKVRYQLAYWYMAMDDFTRAEPLLREGLWHAENGGEYVLGRDVTADILVQLGRCLSGKGDHAAAEPYFRKGVKECRRMNGEKSGETITAMHEHAKCLLQAGRGAQDSGEHELALRRFGEAGIMARMAVQLSQEVLGASHELTLGAMLTLPSVLIAHGRCELASGRRKQWQSKLQEAESTAREYAAAMQQSPRVSNQDMVRCLTMLDDILSDTGHPATGKERKLILSMIAQIQQRQQGAPAEAQQQP